MRQVVCVDKACLLEPSKQQKGSGMGGYPNVQVSQGSAGLGPDAEVVLLPLQNVKERKKRKAGQKKRIIKTNRSKRLKKTMIIKSTNRKKIQTGGQYKSRRARKQTQSGGSRVKQRRKCIKRKHG